MERRASSPVIGPYQRLSPLQFLRTENRQLLLNFVSTEQHLTRQQWSAELKKMEGLGAVIPDSDRTGILNYLTKNFGPETGRTKAAVKKSASTAN